MSAGQNAALKEAQAGASDEGVRRDHPAAGINRVVDADKGTVSLLDRDGNPRKKIALVGFAGSTRMMAPFDDPEWAIVGLNQLNRHIPRADAWFEIHREWNKGVVPGTDHAGWLRDCGIPVVMAERVRELPTSVRFPIEQAIETFTDYFTSTVAYMIAFSIMHIDAQVEERLRQHVPPDGEWTPLDAVKLAKSLYQEYSIGIFGIDLVVGEEYEWQRPCAELYIGEALARGITVMIPPQSALCKQRYRYGYQMEPDDLINYEDLQRRKTELTNEHQKHSEAVVQLIGRLSEISHMEELYKLRERGANVLGRGI